MLSKLSSVLLVLSDCRKRLERRTAFSRGRKIALYFCAVFFLAVSLRVIAAPAPLAGDLIQLLDGSALHGELRAIDVQKGVRWQHPEARQLIDFSPTNLDSIRFDNSHNPGNEAKSSCRFRFNNGDEFLGNLTALDPASLTLETWFGQSLKVPRSAMDSVTFLSRRFRVLYEGPNSTDGWDFGKSTPAWVYRDGALITKSIGTAGRDFKLPAVGSFAFDLSWSGDFNLVIPFYTETLDRFDYGSSSYMFHFSPYSVILQRVHTELGSVSLGRATAIPNPHKKSSYHVELRASKEEATLALLIDGTLVNKWKDDAGFSAKGSGVVFFCQHEGPMIKISNIKVAEWDGKFEEDRSGEARGSKHDLLHLANRDRVTGTIGEVKNEKLTITTAETVLEIPLQRISQIFFNPPPKSLLARDPWEVRAIFAGGEKISFRLDLWDAHQVAGISSSLGKVSFAPAAIRQLQFNLDQAKTVAEPSPEDDWEATERLGDGPVSVSDKEDAVLFRNGDLLYGALQFLEPKTHLRWQRPDVSQPIEFSADGLAEIRFHQQTNAPTSADCRVQLNNTNQLEGNLVSLDTAQVVLDTPYAGRIHLARPGVMMIVPQPAQRTMIYEGPVGLDAWVMGQVNGIPDTGEWKYKNGAFYATKSASIARDLKLPDMASIQFDFAWKGTLQSAIALYTSRMQPINLNTKDSEPDFGGFYSLQLYSYGSRMISVKKDAPLKDLWPMLPIPALSQTNQARIELRVNKGKGSIALFLNGTFIKEMRDPDGFIGTGTAMRFVHQGGSSLKLSNLRITEWDGQLDEKYSNSKGAKDLTKLKNTDKIAGDIEAYHQGKFLIATEGDLLKIPLERVKQIEMAGKKLAPPPEASTEVTAYFRNGYTLNFAIERWDEKGLTARSANFGQAIFSPGTFQRIFFKTDK